MPGGTAMALTPVESSSSGMSSSTPEQESGPTGVSVAESDQTLTQPRKLNLWERFLQKVYSKQEFEAYLINKERKIKEREKKKKKSAEEATEQTTMDSRPDTTIAEDNSPTSPTA